jgi:hypothetical protein
LLQWDAVKLLPRHPRATVDFLYAMGKHKATKYSAGFVTAELQRQQEAQLYNGRRRRKHFL